MALVALISAGQAIDEAGEVPRAALPLAGGALVEHQARLAAAVGAAPVILLVERLPAALTTAVDRLRRDGVQVEIARSLTDAVDRVHPDESLLVMADGCIADLDGVADVAEAAVPALLTVPDDADHARFERIDAGARWAGLLLIDGARLRRTVDQLGEWDLASTLLRRAVQEGALRLAAYAGGEALVAAPESAAEAESLDRALVRSARAPAADWPGRYLFPPAVDLAALPLLRHGVAPRWLAAAAAGLALLALPFALYGLRWTTLALLLLSGPVAALAVRLADVRLVPVARARMLALARALGATLSLLLIAADLATTAGWGCLLLAAIVPVAMAASVREATTLDRLGGGAAPVWLATPDGLVWGMLPAALILDWLEAIALLAAYALASFGFVQARVYRMAAGDAAAGV